MGDVYIHNAHGNQPSDRIIHPILTRYSGRKCSVHISVVIVDLTAFMMRPIHYAKPVQLLSDETVEISRAKRWKLFNCIQTQGSTMSSLHELSVLQHERSLSPSPSHSFALSLFSFFWSHAAHKILNQKQYSATDVLFRAFERRNHERDDEYLAPSRKRINHTIDISD